MIIVRIAIGVVLVFFCVAGVRRGLVRQVFEILGLIAAFIGSFFLAHRLAAYIEGRFDLSYGIALVSAALAIFVCILVIFHFIGAGLRKLFEISVLGWFDRAMGGIFGAIKGLLLVSLILVVIQSLPLKNDFHRRIHDDPFTGVIYPVLPVLYDLVVSRSGGDFEDIVRTGRSISAGEAKG